MTDEKASKSRILSFAKEKKARDKGPGPGIAVFRYLHRSIYDHFCSNLPSKQTNIKNRRLDNSVGWWGGTL